MALATIRPFPLLRCVSSRGAVSRSHRRCKKTRVRCRRITRKIAGPAGGAPAPHASAGDPIEQVKEMFDGGVHYAFEAIGLKKTAEQCFEMLRPGGTATIVGMIPYGTKIEVHGADFLQEKKLIGCAMGSNRFRIDMPNYVDFYLAGRLKLDELLSRHIALEQINEGFEALKSGQVARSVIKFDA